MSATPIITFYGPKGGAGSTCVACAHAVLASASGVTRAAIIDLDLQFGDVAFNLGLSTDVGLGSLVRVLDELTADQLSAAMSMHASGLSVLPAPVDPVQSELVTAYQIRRLLSVAAQEYEAVFVDLGPGLDDRTLAALESSTWVYFVLEPVPGSVAAARKATNVLSKLGVSLAKCGVIVNKCGRAGEVRTQDVARLLSPLPILGEIPFAPETFAAAQALGEPVTAKAPRGALIRYFAPLVSQSLGCGITPPKRGLFEGVR